MAQVVESSEYQVSQIPTENEKKEAGIQKLEQTSAILLHEWGRFHRLRNRKEDESM